MSKVYEMVTDQIIKSLEKGVVPWRKPWNSGLPKNFITKKAYRGINAFLLSNTPFKEPYYLTYLQIQKLGGSVEKGAKSYIVVFWKWINYKSTSSDEEVTEKNEGIPFLRYYRVFNIEQTTGIEYEPFKLKVLDIFQKNENCEKVVNEYKTCPHIQVEEQRAYYSPSKDIINMPIKETFECPEKCYATLFHELIHSTGHKSRLNRDGVVGVNAFGSQDYSKEELIAEMGANFLCAETGIQQEIFDNSLAYIDGWLQRLKNDKKFLISASGKAQKAVDYIRNFE